MLVEGLGDDAAHVRAAASNSAGYPIHFHVWDELTFASFIAAVVGTFDLPLVLDHLFPRPPRVRPSSCCADPARMKRNARLNESLAFLKRSVVL